MRPWTGYGGAEADAVSRLLAVVGLLNSDLDLPTGAALDQ